MTKSVDIYNFIGKKKSVTLEMENVTKIAISIVSGDEIMTVTYKDGTEKEFDADGGTRCINYYDGRYVVYDRITNLIDNPEWKKKKNPYSRQAYAMR